MAGTFCHRNGMVVVSIQFCRSWKCLEFLAGTGDKKNVGNQMEVQRSSDCGDLWIILEFGEFSGQDSQSLTVWNQWLIQSTMGIDCQYG